MISKSASLQIMYLGIHSPGVLQAIDDNLLMEAVGEPLRRGVLLGLVWTNKQGLVGNVKVGGSTGCSDCEVVEFRILCE